MGGQHDTEKDSLCMDRKKTERENSGNLYQFLEARDAGL